MTRILWISECPWTKTSFGKCTFYYTRLLRERGFDIVCACFATTYKLEYGGIMVYPYGNPLERFVEYIERRHGGIDLIVFLGTPWLPFLDRILPQVPHLLRLKRKLSALGVFVIEGLSTSSEVSGLFKKVSFVAVPTRFVAEVVGLPPERYQVIYHGVNPDIWYPREVEKKPGNLFILGMVAKNHPRKRWDMFLALLAHLVKTLGNKYSIKGLLYCPRQGFWKLDRIIDTVKRLYGVELENYILQPENYDVTVGMEEDDEARTLSLMDAHVLLTGGEAFGLPVLETLALGIPNIVPDHPAIREWCGDMCIYYKSSSFIIFNDPQLLLVPDYRDVIEKTVDVIEHYDEYREKALKTSEYVRRTFTWEFSTKLLEHAIDKALKYAGEVIEAVEGGS